MLLKEFVGRKADCACSLTIGSVIRRADPAGRT